MNVADAAVAAGGSAFQGDTDIMTFGGDGSYYVFWTDSSRTHNPAGNSIVGRLYDVLGNPLSAEFRASSNFGGNANEASATELETGELAIAYSFNFGTQSNIYVTIYSPTGNFVRADNIDVRVADTFMPNITPIQGGGYVVTYVIANGGNDFDIEARFVNAAGAVPAPVIVFNDTDISTFPQTATLTNGNILFVFLNQTFSQPGTFDLHFRIYNPAGALLTFGLPAISAQDAPSIAALRGGGFAITWTIGGDVRYLVYDGSGSYQTDGIISNAAGAQNETSVTALPDGGFVVVWEDDNLGRVLGQRYDEDGNIVGNQFIVRNAVSTDSPTAQVLHDGRVAIVSGDVASGDPDLFASIWDPNLNVIKFVDFDGDGKDDVLLRDRDTSAARVAVMDGTAFKITGPAFATNADFRVAGLGDFDADGKADILWRTDDGALYATLMNGTAPKLGASLGPSNRDFTVASTDDFDGDNKADILWRAENGDLYMTLMDGAAFKAGAALGPSNQQFTLVATGDLDGDSKADLLWRNNDGGMYITLMNGTAFKAGGDPGPSGQRWNFEGLGDFDGDAKSDILWRDLSNGNLAITLMNGTSYKAVGEPGGSNLAYHVAGIGDFNADGRADIFWKANNSFGGTYESAVTLMNGTAFLAGGTPGALASSLGIVGDQHFFVL